MFLVVHHTLLLFHNSHVGGTNLMLQDGKGDWHEICWDTPAQVRTLLSTFVFSFVPTFSLVFLLDRLLLSRDFTYSTLRSSLLGDFVYKNKPSRASPDWSDFFRMALQLFYSIYI